MSVVRRGVKAVPRTVTVAFVAAALLMVPAQAQGAPGDIQINKYTVTRLPSPGTTPSQAGAHPPVRIFARFCNPGTFPTFPESGFFGCTDAQVNTQLKDFIVRLPPGLLGNPTATPVCPEHIFAAGACDPSTIVAYTLTRAFVISTGQSFPTDVISPLYNVQTLGLEPARLGTTRDTPSTPPGPFPVTISLRTTSDFGVDSTLENVPHVLGSVATEAKIFQIDTVLCSYAPCAVSCTTDHSIFTGEPIPPHPDLCFDLPDPLPPTVIPASGAKPFAINPTSCKTTRAGLEVRSWQTPGNVTRAQSANPITTTGCANVPFEPDVTTTPDTTQAGAPTGYSVEIKYPEYADDAIWQSQLKDAEVTLPDGVSLSPAGGDGLEACTDEQFGLGNDEPVSCPDASHIGDITVESPVLCARSADGACTGPQPLQGKAFFGPTTAPGRPTADKPWKLFLLLEGAGLRIKLPPGDVTVSDSGQITTVFRGQPELSFTRFELHTRGGPNAVLANPTTCVTHTGSVTLTGHSGAVRDISPTVTPTGCQDPQPFQPVIQDASAIPSQAGVTSRSHLLFSVPDGHQQLKTLKLSLPPGAVGSLAAVPLCPAAVVNALAQDPGANCPDASRVGTIRSTVGSGSGLLTVSGAVYIGEATAAGAAASFVIVIPAKVGPIDLGRVVVVNHAVLRPSDSGVDVLSPDIPNILEGIPLPLRSIEITIDREGFFLNPSGCDTRLFVASFTSYQGGSASADFPTQATGCDQLPFSPKLRLIAGSQGNTAKDSHPPLKAIVTQRRGEANIANARVVVPDIIRPNVPQFQKPGALCTDGQLAARACPPTSLIGNATVRTPVLPFPLTGPVYIVLKAGNPLPELAVFLRNGGIEVLLRAANGFSGIRILNTFNNVPDVPQSYFELNVNGGRNGILNAFSDLCETNTVQPIDATFTGHNGKRVSSKPELEIEGCTLAGARILSRSVNMSRKGVVKLRVGCRKTTPARCRGRLSLRIAGALERKSFSIKQGKNKTVKLKLSRKARKAVRRAKRVRARATLRLRGLTTLAASARSARKTVTVRASRRR
jgi:hypothetical protein